MNYVYLLYIPGTNRTYIGATNDPAHRLRQHNGEIAGGAKATRGQQWTQAFTVSGFPDWCATLQFEWAWKHQKPRRPGLAGKIRSLAQLIALPRPTATALPYSLYPTPITFNVTAEQRTALTKIEGTSFLLEERQDNEMTANVENIEKLKTQIIEISTELSILQKKYDDLLKKVEGSTTKTQTRKAKRKPTAYNNFCRKKRSETKGRKPTFKELGTQWSALSDEDKKKYETL